MRSVRTIDYCVVNTDGGYKGRRATIRFLIVRRPYSTIGVNAMAFVPVPNTVMVELVWNQQGEITENTLYFEGVAPPTATEMEDIAEQVVAWFAATYDDVVSTATSLTMVRVTDLTTQSSPGIEYVTGLPDAGANADAPLPNNVTATVKFLTALRGRSFRGRNYIVGMTESQVNGNLIDAANANAWTSRYANLATNIAALGFDHVVVSRISGGVERTTGLTTPVTGYTMDLVIDSQRRRLPGRGN